VGRRVDGVALALESFMFRRHDATDGTLERTRFGSVTHLADIAKDRGARAIWLLTVCRSHSWHRSRTVIGVWGIGCLRNKSREIVSLGRGGQCGSLSLIGLDRRA